jgi:hypothetical protein
VHPVIQSAAAAQHVKDMLDHAAAENRARDARRARTGRTSRRWGRHAGLGAQSAATRRDAAPSPCAE